MNTKYYLPNFTPYGNLYFQLIGCVHEGFSFRIMKKSAPQIILLALFMLASMRPSANEAKNNTASNMLTPIILTFAISESEKSNPEIITAIQERVLESLKNYQVENIQRFRYFPSMALSIEQAGLDFLKTSNEIILITQDGLNLPSQQKVLNNEKAPCITKKSQIKD